MREVVRELFNVALAHLVELEQLRDLLRLLSLRDLDLRLDVLVDGLDGLAHRGHLRVHRRAQTVNQHATVHQLVVYLVQVLVMLGYLPLEVLLDSG